MLDMEDLKGNPQEHNRVLKFFLKVQGVFNIPRKIKQTLWAEASRSRGRV